MTAEGNNLRLRSG